MSPELQLLLWSAVGTALLHTLAGPDHYLPFIALSKARGWSLGRTVMWTIICGSGHVLSSVALALIASAIGWSLNKIAFLEEVRGGIAGWSLMLFGAGYMTWSVFMLYRNRRHRHFDIEGDGSIYVYEHREGEYVPSDRKHKVTPWVLFIIFLLGPCEPMIPLLYFPAAQSSWVSMIILILVYIVFTLVMMLALVIAGYYGLTILQTPKLEKYMNLLGGFTIAICGVGMVWLEW